VQYINRSHQRSGTLWENRYRSCLTLDDNYVLICQRYIELNPVRAGIVKHPHDYYWSSYSVNAEGDESDLLSEHRAFKNLGRTKTQRKAAYKELFRERLNDNVIDEIRIRTNGNFALGSKDSQNRIMKASGRRVTPGEPGRPRKVS
jgi:putative transposase